MTTTNLFAIQTTFTNGSPTSINPAVFTVVGSDDLLGAFTYSNLADPNNPLLVDPSEPAGEIYSIFINGVRITTDFDIYMAELHWGDGNVSQVLSFEDFPDPDNGVGYLLLLGGDEIPLFATPAEYAIFEDSTGPVLPILSGPFASGTPLQFLSAAATVSLTQNDILVALPGIDDWTGRTISTGLGNDSVFGNGRNEKFDLGNGSDEADGGNGSDTIYGGNGLDTLDGGNGNDRLYGGGHKDRLFGGQGLDKLYGGGDNDMLRGGTDADYLSGDKGKDTLYGDQGADSLWGGDDSDVLYGGDGSDLARGGRGGDKIYGGKGNDSLYGDDGNDVIKGDAGNDKIYGGIGDDTLFGGDGADTFYFTHDGSHDRVSDFVDDIDTLSFNANLGVTSAADALTFATEVGSDVLFNFGTGETLLVLNITKAALLDDIFV